MQRPARPEHGRAGYNIWEKNTNYVAVYRPRDELGPDAFRRMVYQFKPRSQQDPTFGAFDCPDAALVAPRRNASTTALQALNLLNSRFTLQQASFFAERLEKEAGAAPELQAARGFALAFGRAPPSELAAAVALIGSHGTAAFCGPVQRQRVRIRAVIRTKKASEPGHEDHALDRRPRGPAPLAARTGGGIQRPQMDTDAYR